MQNDEVVRVRQVRDFTDVETSNRKAGEHVSHHVAVQVVVEVRRTHRLLFSDLAVVVRSITITCDTSILMHSEH